MKKYIKHLYLIFIIIFMVFGLISLVSAASTDLSLERNFDLEYVNSSQKANLKTEDLYLPDFHIRGIYVNGWVAGIPEKMDKLIRLVKNSVLNTMVINIKDDLGFLSYESNVNLARQISANRYKVKNIKKLLNNLHNNGIYTIARIVVFKDSLLAQKRPELALNYYQKTKKKKVKSKKWVNPEKKGVWDYNIRLAREAFKLGFDEVQFDYIRFPVVDNDASQIILTEQKDNIINSFVIEARERLADMSGPISVDVFGMTTATSNGLGIGQNFLELSSIVDIISPMIYPSHYAPGSYGVKVPAKSPYKIISGSMIDAKKKIMSHNNVIIRPWLQDFSLKYSYKVDDVRKQLEAVKDLGINEWLLWNSRSKYTEEVFLKPPM